MDAVPASNREDARCWGKRRDGGGEQDGEGRMLLCDERRTGQKKAASWLSEPPFPNIEASISGYSDTRSYFTKKIKTKNTILRYKLANTKQVAQLKKKRYKYSKPLINKLSQTKPYKVKFFSLNKITAIRQAAKQ